MQRRKDAKGRNGYGTEVRNGYGKGVRGGKRDGVREKGKGWKGKTILRHFVFFCPVLVCFFISFFPLLFLFLVLVLVLVFLAPLRLCAFAFPSSTLPF